MRQLLLLFVSIGFLCACKPVRNDIEDPVEIIDESQYIKEWFEYLCSPELGGRYSGSYGIVRAMNYISDVIGWSDSLRIDSFSTDRCDMNNIIYHIKGSSDTLVVLGAHYDAYGYVNKTALPGADDNLSGVAVLLQVIKKIQKEKFRPHYSLDICFWDGEEIGLYGSNYYVCHLNCPIMCYINVDMCGSPLCGLSFAFSDYSPNITNVFLNIQEKLNMKVEEYHPVNYTTDCESFYRMKIPFIHIGNDNPLMPYIHSMRDDISCVSFPRINNISAALYEDFQKL